MKIAVLSDIHGNCTALKAVLAEAQMLRVQRLFLLGDFVGYYYYPDQVMTLLESWSVDMVQGNHEAMLKAAAENPAIAQQIRQKYGSGIEMALQKLSPKWIQTLTTLPTHKTIEVEGRTFLLCHGSPWNRDQYIYPNADAETLDRCAAVDADFVLMGHTHHPFVCCRRQRVIANAGSVGQARDKGGMASWIVINTTNGTLSFKHTRYDPSWLIEDTKRIDPHLPYLHEVLTRA